jgi:hypothetical protein
MEFLLLPYLINFCVWLIQREIIVEYLNKQEIKTFFISERNLNSFNENSLQRIFTSLTSESYSKIYSLFCNHFLREMERKGNFIRRTNNSKFIQTHHIKPRFENGSEEPSNRISLHIYYHGIAHLLRFFFSNNPNDINGVNSSLRNENEIDRANLNRQSEQRIALQDRPIGRPFTKGRVPTQQPVTEAQRAAGSLAGFTSQRKNSFKRVNPFTRFCTSLRMVWEHTSGIEKEVLLNRKRGFIES